MTAAPDWSFGKRWRSAALVFVVTLIAPLFVGLILRGDAAAVGGHLKWPMSSPYQALIINGAFLLAAMSGGAAFLLARRPWLIWTPACVLCLLAVLFCAPFAQGWTRLDRGSITISSGWPSKARSYGLPDVGEVRVGCRYFRLNRWAQTVGLSYVAILKDGTVVHATSGTPIGGKPGLGPWLTALNAWDAQPGFAPRRLVEPSSAQCLKDLDADLDAQAHEAAVRILARATQSIPYVAPEVAPLTSE